MITRPLFIFDLDGTLAHIEHRLHFIRGEGKKDWPAFFEACIDDSPNWPMIATLQELSWTGCEIWVWSGRSDEVYQHTVQWLADHLIEYDKLQMRTKGDFRDDAVVKREWLDAMHPNDRSRLVMTFDDRNRVVKMWRDAGITCAQVAPGDF